MQIKYLCAQDITILIGYGPVMHANMYRDHFQTLLHPEDRTRGKER